MLVRVSKEQFRSMTAELSNELGLEVVNESALPSYLHSNPLIPWIVWRRLGKVLQLAGKEALAGDVLDFGCGTGSLLPSLCNLAKKVYGTDLFLHFSKKLVSDLKLSVELLATDKLFSFIKPASLSLVTAVEVFEHIEDMSSILSSISDLLLPDGKLVVSSPTESSFYGICRAIAGFKGDYHHKNASHINEEIIQSGFRLLDSYSLPFPFFPSLFVVSSYMKAD